MAINDISINFYENGRNNIYDESLFLTPLHHKQIKKQKKYTIEEIPYFIPHKEKILFEIDKDIINKFTFESKRFELIKNIEKILKELSIYLSYLSKQENIKLIYKLIEKEIDDISIIENKLNKILKNVKNRNFTLEDAQEFIEKISPFIKRKLKLNELSPNSHLVKQYEYLRDIYWKKFYWITGTLETLLILGILYEDNKPYTEQKLIKKILELEPKIHPFSLKASLEILKKYGYINQKKSFFKKSVYTLTIKGEITIILIKDIYKNIMEKIKNKYGGQIK